MFYIYHIEGKKIGCTDNVQRRVVDQQGYTNYEILEEHEDIYIASEREIELQKQYGYGRDTNSTYAQSYFANQKRAQIVGDKLRGTTLPEETKVKISNTLRGNKNAVGYEVPKERRDAMRMFTKEQADEIRNKYVPYKYGMYALADEYNTTHTTIFAIIHNKNGY